MNTLDCAAPQNTSPATAYLGAVILLNRMMGGFALSFGQSPIESRNGWKRLHSELSQWARSYSSSCLDFEMQEPDGLDYRRAVMMHLCFWDGEIDDRMYDVPREAWQPLLLELLRRRAKGQPLDKADDEFMAAPVASPQFSSIGNPQKIRSAKPKLRVDAADEDTYEDQKRGRREPKLPDDRYRGRKPSTPRLRRREKYRFRRQNTTRHTGA